MEDKKTQKSKEQAPEDREINYIVSIIMITSWDNCKSIRALDDFITKQKVESARDIDKCCGCMGICICGAPLNYPVPAILEQMYDHKIYGLENFNWREVGRSFLPRIYLEAEFIEPDLDKILKCINTLQWRKDTVLQTSDCRDWDSSGDESWCTYVLSRLTNKFEVLS